MITKIEHIGIAVKDPKKSNEIFEKLLGHASFKSELAFALILLFRIKESNNSNNMKKITPKRITKTRLACNFSFWILPFLG